MSSLIFDVRVLSGDVFTSAFSDQARHQSSVTLVVFPPVTLRPTGTAFDDCRAVVLRVYPAAGAQLMSRARRAEIEKRDARLSRSPQRYFHACQTALAGPVFDTFSETFHLDGGWAVGIVIVREDIVALASGAIEHLLPRTLERYFGPLPFKPKFNGPSLFQEKGVDAAAIVNRLWEPYPVPNDADKPT